MAHSLESARAVPRQRSRGLRPALPVRLKLRDLEHVVELDENEPGPKTESYFERTRDGKLLLRQVMERYVPETVTEQVKQGFSGPDASWFRGDSIDYVAPDRAQPATRRMYEFLSRRPCSELVDEHLEGRANRRLLLWSLLNFEHWCGTFLERERGRDARSRTLSARDRSPRTAIRGARCRARSSTTRSRYRDLLVDHLGCRQRVPRGDRRRRCPRRPAADVDGRRRAPASTTRCRSTAATARCWRAAPEAARGADRRLRRARDGRRHARRDDGRRTRSPSASRRSRPTTSRTSGSARSPSCPATTGRAARARSSPAPAATSARRGARGSSRRPTSARLPAVAEIHRENIHASAGAPRS